MHSFGTSIKFAKVLNIFEIVRNYFSTDTKKAGPPFGNPTLTS